jgi:sulfonate transport system ATP-binding protein
VSVENAARVELENVDKAFADRKVLSRVNLSVQPGEFVSIVGRSGSGKSTLLRLLCGLEQPTRGTLRIDSDIAESVRVVFQEPRLLPWRTVLQNVTLGKAGVDARDVLARVGLAERANDFPAVLSGGQRQRVALARALVHKPRLLLLDEPFGALDALTRIEMQQLVESLWREHRFTAIMVTHDVSEAVQLSDRVLIVEDGMLTHAVSVELARPRARDVPELAQLTAALLARVVGRPSLSSVETNAR